MPPWATANLAEENVERVALGFLARLADRHDDPPPIGVLAGARGLHQRRIGDRERNAPGRLAARRALDIDGDELARSLAVAHHLLREIAQELVKPAPEGGRARIGGVLDPGRRRASPVAKIISVSEVDVSLSTVIALNERSTDFDSIACSAPGAIAASVKT